MISTTSLVKQTIVIVINGFVMPAMVIVYLNYLEATVASARVEQTNTWHPI